MQQKGDGSHVILVSKTSYFKDTYCGETFVIFLLFLSPNLRLITFLFDYSQHYGSQSPENHKKEGGGGRKKEPFFFRP